MSRRQSNGELKKIAAIVAAVAVAGGGGSFLDDAFLPKRQTDLTPVVNELKTQGAVQSNRLDTIAANMEKMARAIDDGTSDRYRARDAKEDFEKRDIRIDSIERRLLEVELNRKR